MVGIKDDRGVCELKMMFAMPPTIPSEDALKNQIKASGERLVANSVEKALNIQKLPGATFSPFYFELTDKREDGGNGRFMLQGIGVSGKYTCLFMMLTNEKSSDAKAAILKALGTVRIGAKP